jgi:hypothetical protein
MALAIFYPCGEILILSAIVAFIQREVKAVAWWTLFFLGIGMVFDAIADTLFAVYVVSAASFGWYLLNTAWMLASCFIIAGIAWQLIPDESIRNRAPARFTSKRLLRTAIPYLTVPASLFVLMLAAHNTGLTDIRFLGVLFGSLLLAVLVLVRQFLVL